MAGVAREPAIEGECAGAVRLEFKCGRASGRHPLRDAVFVDGEAVRDVLAPDGELYEVVLSHLDASRGVVEVLRDDREFTPVGSFLGEQAAHRWGRRDDAADAEEQQTERTAGHSHNWCDGSRTVLVRPIQLFGRARASQQVQPPEAAWPLRPATVP